MGSRPSAPTRVLVAAAGADPGAAVDPRFGRAPWLLLVDVASGSIVSVVDNLQGLAGVRESGLRAAELAVSLDAQVVLTGHCGPKARAALRASGIMVVSGVVGTVREAVADLREGRLRGAADGSPCGP